MPGMFYTLGNYLDYLMGERSGNILDNILKMFKNNESFNLGVQGSNPCGLTSKAITWSLKKSPARKFGQYAPNGHSAGQI